MNHQAPRVLTKASLRALSDWQLSPAQSAAALEVTMQHLAALESGQATLEEGSPSWGRALDLLELNTQLAAVLGSASTVAVWMQSTNRALDGRPADLLKDAKGLRRVADYVRAGNAIT